MPVPAWKIQRLLMNVILVFYKKKTQIGMAKKEGIRKLFDNIAPESKVIGVDISEGMMAIGREKINLSVGGELEFSANFVAKGFHAMPAIGAK